MICFTWNILFLNVIASEEKQSEEQPPLAGFIDGLDAFQELMKPFVHSLPKNEQPAEVQAEYEEAYTAYLKDTTTFEEELKKATETFKGVSLTNTELVEFIDGLEGLGEQSRGLVKQADLLYKLAEGRRISK